MAEEEIATGPVTEEHHEIIDNLSTTWGIMLTLQENLNMRIGTQCWKKYINAAFWNYISTMINFSITLFTAMSAGQTGTKSNYLTNDQLFYILFVSFILSIINTFFKLKEKATMNYESLKQFEEFGAVFETIYFSNILTNNDIDQKYKRYLQLQDNVNKYSAEIHIEHVNYITEVIFICIKSLFADRIKRIVFAQRFWALDGRPKDLYVHNYSINMRKSFQHDYSSVKNNVFKHRYPVHPMDISGNDNLKPKEQDDRKIKREDKWKMDRELADARQKMNANLEMEKQEAMAKLQRQLKEREEAEISELKKRVATDLECQEQDAMIALREKIKEREKDEIETLQIKLKNKERTEWEKIQSILDAKTESEWNKRIQFPSPDALNEYQEYQEYKQPNDIHEPLDSRLSSCAARQIVHESIDEKYKEYNAILVNFVTDRKPIESIAQSLLYAGYNSRNYDDKKYIEDCMYNCGASYKEIERLLQCLDYEIDEDYTYCISPSQLPMPSPYSRGGPEKNTLPPPVPSPYSSGGNQAPAPRTPRVRFDHNY